MRVKKTYTCEYCEKEFDSEQRCADHEKMHIKSYSGADNGKLARAIRVLDDNADGYHIGREILGMPTPNFHSLMETVARRLEGKDSFDEWEDKDA